MKCAVIDNHCVSVADLETTLTDRLADIALMLFRYRYLRALAIDRAFAGLERRTQE